MMSLKAGEGKPYPVQQYAASPLLLPQTSGKFQGIAAQPGGVPQEGTSGILSNIHEAIAYQRADVIEDLIQKNPALVHDRGFNKQTTLHRAALRGEPEIVELLLRYGADPNAGNAFNEKPIHFACKRGSPRILHLLADNGADVTAVDQAGKGTMHHAAQGGSVLAMHYLVVEYGASTKSVDSNLSTLLHIACSQNHSEVFQYLMKKERCDMYARDINGNNCMHLAAHMGHSSAVWALLQNGGLSMLFDHNKEGATPLDMAMKGHHFRHKAVAKLLLFYTKRDKRTGRAQGPILGWYFHLLLPICMYPLVLMAAYSIPSWSGWIAGAGMVTMVTILARHSHRMKHASRWQNPVQMGTFAAGFYHTTICFYWNIFPSLSMERPFLAWAAILLTALMNIMYYRLLTMNPGVATQSAEKDSGEFYTVRDIALGNVRLEAFCPECEIIPPRRTHHCKLCEKCYLDCDHHCLFLYRCIAKNSHRLFLSFIIVDMLAMLLFMWIAVSYLMQQYPTGAIDFSFAGMVFYAEPWIWTALLANASSWLWGLQLLRFQLMLISKGHTTAYQPYLGKTNLNNAQRVRNVLHLFLGRKPYAVDQLIKV